MLKRFYIILAFLFLAPTLQAQDEKAVSFELNLSKEKLGLNERLRVEFAMNQDGDNFTPPKFDGFRVLMGPLQSISSSWINGVRSYSKTYSYTLAPTARGKFKIGQASIVIKGKTYKSLAKQIEVTAAVDKPSDQMTIDDVADESLHLVAEVSKTTPYLNEAVSVVYKLYVSPSISVSNYRPLDNPKYNNFWSQDIPVSIRNAKNGTYKGKAYRYVILKRVVLYPQKSGELEIEPLSLEVTVDVPTNKRDFFGGRIYSQTNKTVSAGKRTIEVKQLPLENKPENFNGAVGDFDFKITASKNDLKANESSQIKVAVTGKGNLKLFEIPKIEAPKELEIYTPEHKESVRTTLSGIRGSVYDLYTVVPQYKGKYKIPKVSFSYFNPKEKKYKTITTEDVFVNVLEGKEIVTTTNNIVKKDVAVTGTNFRYIQTKSTFKPVKTVDFFKSSLFYILLLLPLIAIPIGIIIYNTTAKRNSDLIGVKQRKADRLAKKYLSEAKKQLGNKEAFYIALEKALHNYLKAKLQIETAEISRDNIKEILQSKNVDKTTINSFLDVLNDCDFARYTPITEVMMQDEFEKAKEVITALDKQL